MNFSFQLWKVWENKLKLKKSFVKKENDTPVFPSTISQFPAYLAFWQTQNSCIPLRSVVQTQEDCSQAFPP